MNIDELASLPAEGKLAVSELRYRRLFETAKDGILILDAETGMVVDVNPFLVELVGYTHQQFLNKAIWELGFMKDAIASQKKFHELQRQEYVRYENLPLETADGRRKDVEFVSNVYRVGNKRVIQCNIRDITERRQAAAALKESEERYRLLFEQSPDGIVVIDPETARFLAFNETAHRQLGYSRAEFAQLRISDVEASETSQETGARIATVLRQGRNDFETLHRTRQGEIRNIYVTAQFIEKHGQPIYHCVWRDITARKLADAERERLLTAVQQSAEMILITDADGTIRYGNPAFEKTSGYNLKELVGQTSRILRSGKQNAEFYQQMWGVLTAGEVWRGRMINRRKDGTFYEDDASIAPVRDAAGKIVNYVAAMRDVTHEARLEKQLRQAQKMEAVGRLAGGVAHDFNNLLMGIMGYVELCRNELPLTHPIRHYLDKVADAAKRSVNITRQLLAFARKQDIAPKVMDLNTAVSDMLNLLRQLIGEGISLTWRPGDGVKRVRLDPSQVDQILANLFANARDAIAGVGKIDMETGNSIVDAEYCAGHPDAIPGAYVLLTVSDDGCGMDQETLAQIFEPFFTTKDIGKGTGLGLATVYGIVKQNNGFIDASSEPGKGTTFKIYLPQVATEAAVEPIASRAETPKGRGETILVAEDNDSVREICSHFLDGLGYRVLLAETPEAALQIAGRHSGDIDLLLSDVVMPGMDGRQLAERLGSDRPCLKVLFMSGHTADVMAKRGLLPQGINFIAKPFSCDEIGRKVREVLEGANASPE